MSFKHLHLKPGLIVLGLVALIALLPILSANEQVRAATPAISCGTASGQNQACLAEGSNIKKAKSEVTDLALFTPATGKAKLAKSASEGNAPKQELHASSHLAEALVLFAIAVGGIVFLGRRRKVPTYRN